MIELTKPLAVIKVENSSEKTIEKLGFTYDGAGIQLFNIKNLEPKKFGEVKIPTEYFRKETIIRMYTENGHIYKIKGNINKNDNIAISINLEKVNLDGSLEFEIVKEGC